MTGLMVCACVFAGLLTTALIPGFVTLGRALAHELGLWREKRKSSSPFSALTDYAAQHFTRNVAHAAATLGSLVTSAMTIATFALTPKGGGKVALATAVMATLTAITHLVLFLGISLDTDISETDLAQMAIAIQSGATSTASDEWNTATPQSFELIGQFLATTLAALVAAWNSRRSPTEIFGHVAQNWGKTHSSTGSFWDALKRIWTSFNPDANLVSTLDNFRLDADRLEAIYLLDNTVFARKVTQYEIEALKKAREESHVKILDMREEAVKMVNTRWMMAYSRILTRQNELASLISQSAQIRRKPVFINLMGPGGHGKSYMLNQLYADISKKLRSQGLLDVTMRKVIGSGGGDDYLPPMSDEEWIQIDEYLMTYDDKWIGVTNALVSDNPVTLSSAFVKFFSPEPHFIITTSNITLPFTIPSTHKNYMRPDVREAWNSRHNFFNIVKPDYNPRISRDMQDRTTPPVITAKLFRGKDKWEDDFWSYSQLVDWAVDQWKLFDAKYKKAVQDADDLAKQFPPPPAIPHADNTSMNPRVLGIFGKPGEGKTHFLNKEVLPTLRLTKKPKVYSEITSRPDTNYNLHIIDDLLGPSQQWLMYKKFYDALDGNHTIIVVDNYLPRWKWSIHWGIVFQIIRTRKWENPIYWTPDFSDLPHESVARRIGFGCSQTWRNKSLSPAVGNADAWEFSTTGIKDLNGDSCAIRDTQAVVEEWFGKVISSQQLQDIPDRPHPPAKWDLEINVSSADNVAAVYMGKVPGEYIRVDPSMATAFPDWRSLFFVDVNSPDIHEGGARALRNAYRRKPYAAHIRYQDYEWMVADGKLWMNKAVALEHRSSEICQESLKFRIGEYRAEVSFADIHAGSVPLDGLDYTQRRWLAEQCDIVRATIPYKRYVDEHRYSGLRDMYVAKAEAAWNTLVETVKRHKKLTFIVGALSVVGGLAYILYRTTSSESKETLEKRLAKAVAESQEGDTTRVAIQRKTVAKAESYEQGTRMSTIVRKPVGTPAINPVDAPPNKVSPAGAAATTAAGHALRGVELRGCLSPEIRTVRKHVEEALVYVTQSMTTYGLLVADNYVLTISHSIVDPKEPISIIETDADGKLQQWRAAVQFIDRQRDIALLRITERSFRKRANLTRFFVKEGMMHNVFQTMHLLPDNVVLTGDASFREQLKSGTIRDASLPHWNPCKRIIYTDFLGTTKFTQKGDCGTAVITPQRNFGAAVICGIHIGAFGANESRGIVATVSQEELERMINWIGPVEAQSAPPQDAVVIELDGQDFLIDELLSNKIGYEFSTQVPPIPTNDRIEPIGYFPSLYEPSHRRGGALVHTPISKHLDPEVLPDLMLPAPVSYNDPNITPAALAAMATDFRGKPSIGLTQLHKICGPTGGGNMAERESEIDQELFDVTIETYLGMMETWEGMDRWQPLTMHEALNGMEDAFFEGLVGPLATDTSPGFPYKQVYNAPRKSDAISYDDALGIRTFSASLAGRKASERASILWDRALHAKDGPELLHVVECHLKVETLPIEKVENGKTRVFLLESLDHILFQKRVLGGLQAIVMKNRWNKFCHHTTGINPYKEYHQMYECLRRVSEYGIDWDYERFDKRAPAWVQFALEAIFQYWMGKNHWFSSLEEAAHMAQATRRSLFEKYYLFEGVLYRSWFDWASGLYFTNAGGSMMNDLYIISAVQAIAKDKLGRYLNVEEIHSILSWFTNGDDVIMTISEDFLSIFDFTTFKKQMRKNGLFITPSDKNAADYTYKKLNDLSFIGRTFEFDVTSPTKPLGKLRESAVFGMLHWTENPVKEQVYATLDSFCIELRAYPQKEYVRIADAVRTALRKLKWTYAIPSWEQARLEALATRDGLDIGPIIMAQAQSTPNAESLCIRLQTERSKVETGTLREAILRDTWNNTRASSDARELEVTSAQPAEGRGALPSREEHGENAARGREVSSKPNKAAFYVTGVATNAEGLEVTRPGSVACTIHGGSGALVMKNSNSSMETKNQNNFISAIINFFSSFVFDNDINILKVADAVAIAREDGANRIRFQGVSYSPTGLNGHITRHGLNTDIPSWMWRAYSCHACGTQPIGMSTFVRHVANSHSHLEGVNFSSVSGVDKQSDEAKQTDNVFEELGKEVVRNHLKFARNLAHELDADRVYVQASGQTAFDRPKLSPSNFRYKVNKYNDVGFFSATILALGLQFWRQIDRHVDQDVHGIFISGSSNATAQAGEMLMPEGATSAVGTDPASVAAADASRGVAATAATAGINPIPAAPGLATGTASAGSTIMLRAPGIPMEQALVTGAQWDQLDLIYGAFTQLLNGTISNTAYPEGTKVFDLPIHSYGGQAKNWLMSHLFVSGGSEYQVTLYGTTNTTGAIIVYDEELADNEITIERALARPHVVISAANGTSTVSFTVEDCRMWNAPRMTDDMDDAPRLRAIMYSPLVNSFGTDLSLNLKVLSRPAPSFRVWSPRTSAARDLPTEYNLPFVPYVELETNKELGMVISHWYDESMETPGYNRYCAVGATPLPSGPTVAYVGAKEAYMDMTNNAGSDGQGFIKPCGYGLFESGQMSWNALLAKATPSDIISNMPSPHLTTAVGCVPLTQPLADGDVQFKLVKNSYIPMGYTGLSGDAGEEGCLKAEVYAGGYNDGRCLQQKKWLYDVSLADTPGAAIRRDTIMQAVRNQAEAALEQPPSFAGNRECSIWPAYTPGPGIPAGTTASFAAPDSAWHEWAVSLKKLYDDNQLDYSVDLSAHLEIDGTDRCVVRIFHKDGKGFFMTATSDIKYLEVEATSSIRLTRIQRHLALETPPLNPNNWTQRQDETREIDPERVNRWRETLATAKYPIPGVQLRTIKRKTYRDIEVSIAQAAAVGAVAGGVLGGIGQGLGQWAQNKFWGKEFKENRKHEMEMLRVQTAADRALQAQTISANHFAQVGMMRGKFDKMGLGGGVRAPPSYEESQAQQKKTPLEQDYATAMKQERHLEAFRAKTRATDNAPALAKPPTGDQTGQIPLPQGEMTSHSQEQYHAASIMAGAKIDPVSVASAQAPYTEAMKRT